jgi:hypothetical protein
MDEADCERVCRYWYVSLCGCWVLVRGWMDGNHHNVDSQLTSRTRRLTCWQKHPAPYNAWILFRNGVDNVLANDVLAFLLFSLRYMEDVDSGLDVFSIVVGLLLGCDSRIGHARLL